MAAAVEVDLVHGLLGSGLFAAVFHQTSARLAPYEAQLALSALLIIASLALPQARSQQIAGLTLGWPVPQPASMPYYICVAAIPLVACIAGTANGLAQVAWLVVLAAAIIVCDRNTPSLDGFYWALTLLALLVAVALRRRPDTV